MKINISIFALVFISSFADIRAMEHAKDIYQLHEEEKIQTILAARQRIIKEQKSAEEQCRKNKWIQKESEKKSNNSMNN